MAEIALANGGVALVDDEDLEMLSSYNWMRGDKGYAIAYIGHGRGRPAVKMHRLIMGAKGEEIVDHRNLNDLDNHRANLRVCSHADNAKNRRMHKNNKLGIKGVYLERRPGREQVYRAEIRVNKKRIHLGRHATPEAAQEAYRAASIKYHGEFSTFVEAERGARHATR